MATSIFSTSDGREQPIHYQRMPLQMGVSKSKSAKPWHLQDGVKIVEQASGSLPVPAGVHLDKYLGDSLMKFDLEAQHLSSV